MSIVRSLLIKVGFVTDKQTINQTNKAIAGFKTRFAIAASAAAYAFSKITNYFSEIATATLDAESLAKTLGISFVEFTKLQKAAEGFRINDKQFTSLFQALNKNIVNFRYKLDGELLKLSQAFDFDPTKINNSAQLFDAIINKLATIEDYQKRIDFAEIHFEGLGEKLANIAGNTERFRDSVEGFEGFANELQKSIPALNEYEQAVIGLSNVWQNFVVTISKDVIPVLTNLISYLQPSFDLLKGVYNLYGNLFKGDKQGVIDSARSVSKSLDPVFDSVGSAYQGTKNVLSGLISDVFSPWWERVNDYVENRDYGMVPATSMGAPMITNNIDIQVGPGTTEQQAQFMSDRIEQQVEASIYNTFQNIQNNNPMVE